MALFPCNIGGGDATSLDLGIPKRGTIIHILNPPNANSGGYWGLVFLISAIEDDMVFTITASSANTNTKINGVFAYGLNNYIPTAQTSRKTIYAYNANLRVATITGAQLKNVLSAQELATYDYIAFDFSTYAGDGYFTFEIT